MTLTTYRYTTPSGQCITVWIERDCGIVRGKENDWHKVLCRPIGFNNCPVMSLDLAELQEVY